MKCLRQAEHDEKHTSHRNIDGDPAHKVEREHVANDDEATTESSNGKTDESFKP